MLRKAEVRAETLRGNEAIESQPVTSIEGTPTVGTFFVKPMITGANLSMFEVRLARGARSQMHQHSHESLIYVVSGALKTVIGEQQVLVRSGEACCHPENVVHSVEAMEDTIFIEVKAPAPELRTVLGI
jgi:quercetin dioxygenase-like cupin family protein